MFYPTPNELPTPEEVEQAREAAEAEPGTPLSQSPSRELVVAGTAAAIAFSGTYVGSQMLTIEKQDAYSEYHNTLGSLTKVNEKLYSEIATMPASIRVTHEGKAIGTQIDAVNTEIADVKYNYEGGIEPAAMLTASTLLGLVAAGAAFAHYISTAPRHKKASPKV